MEDGDYMTITGDDQALEGRTPSLLRGHHAVTSDVTCARRNDPRREVQYNKTMSRFVKKNFTGADFPGNGARGDQRRKPMDIPTRQRLCGDEAGIPRNPQQAKTFSTCRERGNSITKSGIHGAPYPSSLSASSRISWTAEDYEVTVNRPGWYEENVCFVYQNWEKVIENERVKTKFRHALFDRCVQTLGGVVIRVE